MLSIKYNNLPSGVWAREDSSSFDYSDGDEVEERLLRQVRQVDDVSLASDELQRLIVDWPSEYHFSPLRANLLSPFHFNHFNNVLEIGSGCGAITRVLGEQCSASTIIALEGSMRRAEITRARCRELKNVHVCCDSFADFEHGTLFDMITMIGVLEYSPSYFKGSNPIVSALARARHLLSENGVLVVAIENQLGLKYFNGCGEDHNGQPFFGINDQYQPGTFCTFGKKQLQKQIEQAGFNRVEFVYPFPDYKLPQLMLREQSFQCTDFDISHLVGQYPSRDYSRSGDTLFQEATVWKLLAQNGLVRNLANSFLVFAFQGSSSIDDITEPWIARAFSCRRKKRYLVETVFRKEHDVVAVEKKVCYPQTSSSTSDLSQAIIHHVGEADYIKGVPYGYTLCDRVSKEGALEQFISYLKPWVEWLRENIVSSATSGGEEGLMVSGELYDCMPANFLINNQQQICLIDQEWEYKDALELGFVFFRGLYRELSTNIRFFEQSDLFNNGTAGYVLEQIFKAFHLPLDMTILERYIDLEIRFQLELVVYGVTKEQLSEYLSDFFKEKRAQRSDFGEMLTSGGVARYDVLIRQKAELEGQVLELKQLVIERDKLVSTVFSSHSWRLTAPLRFIVVIVKRAKRLIGRKLFKNGVL